MNKIVNYLCSTKKPAISSEKAIELAIITAQEHINKAITQNNNESTYFYSYPFFIEHFNRTFSKTTSTNSGIRFLIQGMFMIYGWMPTILHLKCEYTTIDAYISKIFEILQYLKFCKYEEIDKFLFADSFNACSPVSKTFVNRFSFLQSFINNSIPGTTKLLHFIRPEDFPILDSKIYSRIYNNKTAFAGTPNTYREYIKDMHDIRLRFENLKQIQEAISNMKSMLGYQNLTLTRAIELSIFLNK